MEKEFEWGSLEEECEAKLKMVEEHKKTYPEEALKEPYEYFLSKNDHVEPVRNGRISKKVILKILGCTPFVVCAFFMIVARGKLSPSDNAMMAILFALGLLAVLPFLNDTRDFQSIWHKRERKIQVACPNCNYYGPENSSFWRGSGFQTLLLMVFLGPIGMIISLFLPYDKCPLCGYRYIVRTVSQYQRTTL